jgi:uncharacterized protein with FMN-binding domain
MKRIILSVLVIFTFALYVYQERFGEPISSPQIPDQPISTRRPSLNSPKPLSSSPKYKDGTYTGKVADAYYGNLQVSATISGGKISDVKFLQYPNDRQTSIMINQQAIPVLKQEAIQAQSAQVDIVSGATQSSQAFIESLASALSKAK